ncbi:MAG: MFS transporter [Firmicutes bacterium]|nr:MFS transporter [Bacillota bacterium]
MNVTSRRRFFFALLVFSFWAPVYTYTQILPVYTRRLGGSLAMVGMVGSAYGLTQLLLRIPLGIWSDRLGRRAPFIVGGFLASVFSNLLFLFATTPQALFWARAMAGVSSAVWVILTVLATESFPPGETTGIMGLLVAVSNIGQLVASIGGAALAGVYGWQAPFSAALITGLCGLFLSLGCKDETTIRKTTFFFRDLMAVAGRPSVLVSSLLGLIVQYIYWAMTGFGPVLATELGSGRHQLVWISLAQMGPAVAVAFLVGLLAVRVGPRRLLLLSFLLFGLGAGLAPTAGNLLSLCLFIGLTALARGISYPLLLSLAIREVPATQTATAMGFFQAVYAAGMFLGPAVSGGLTRGAGLEAAFFVAAGLATVGGAISLAFPRPEGA